MNICYLIRSFSSQAGTESYVYNMSMALAQRRCSHKRPAGTDTVSVHSASMTAVSPTRRRVERK